MRDAFKRKSTILICFGLILYVISVCIPMTVDANKFYEVVGEKWIADSQISQKATALMRIVFYIVPFLVGLAEFICAIANKKAVFILSVVQMVFSVFISVIPIRLMPYVNSRIVFYLPIVACALLLAGGIMFKKEKIARATEN